MTNDDKAVEVQHTDTTADFRKELEVAINRYSRENGSNTPDFILAEYLANCLDAYDKALVAREMWYWRY